MLDYLGMILLWVCSLLLLMSCICFILAMRELYIMRRENEGPTGIKLVMVVIILLPVMNVVALFVIMLHAFWETFMEWLQRRGYI
jgi:hypothetical protein